MGLVITRLIPNGSEVSRKVLLSNIVSVKLQSVDIDFEVDTLCRLDNDIHSRIVLSTLTVPLLTTVPLRHLLIDLETTVHLYFLVHSLTDVEFQVRTELSHFQVHLFEPLC